LEGFGGGRISEMGVLNERVGGCAVLVKKSISTGDRIKLLGPGFDKGRSGVVMRLSTE
jgi:hypothetical protein